MFHKTEIKLILYIYVFTCLFVLHCYLSSVFSHILQIFKSNQQPSPYLPGIFKCPLNLKCKEIIQGKGEQRAPFLPWHFPLILEIETQLKVDERGHCYEQCVPKFLCWSPHSQSDPTGKGALRQGLHVGIIAPYGQMANVPHLFLFLSLPLLSSSFPSLHTHREEVLWVQSKIVRATQSRRSLTMKPTLWYLHLESHGLGNG